MKHLITGFFREMASPWWHLSFLLAVFLAAALSFDASLGSHSFGTYLAYISLLPMVLLFRCGWLLQKRAGEGWPQEEILRDPTSRRAPLAEFAASALLLLEVLVLALVPIYSNLFTLPGASSGLYPVRIEVQVAAESPDTEQWLFDLGGTVPEGARLQLTLDWSEALMPPEEVRIHAPDQRSLQPKAGRLFAWGLSPREAKFGKVVLQPTPGSNVVLRSPLCRLEILRPGREQLPILLSQQLLFFLPLFAILLAWFRFGRIRGGLSAMAAFTFGSLAAMQVQPVDLGSGPLAGLAKMLLLLKLAMPPVEGLLATGQRYERLAGTVSISTGLAWGAVGALALFLACRRRPPRAR